MANGRSYNEKKQEQRLGGKTAPTTHHVGIWSRLRRSASDNYLPNCCCLEYGSLQRRRLSRLAPFGVGFSAPREVPGREHVVMVHGPELMEHSPSLCVFSPCLNGGGGG